MRHAERYIRVLTVCIIILSFSACEKPSSYTLEVIKTSSGYGYVISVAGKILIKQEHIPALHGASSFCSADDALKVAKTVQEKLKKGENPGITVKELTQLGIDFKCLDLPPQV